MYFNILRELWCSWHYYRNVINRICLVQQHAVCFMRGCLRKNHFDDSHLHSVSMTMYSTTSIELYRKHFKAKASFFKSNLNPQKKKTPTLCFSHIWIQKTWAHTTFMTCPFWKLERLSLFSVTAWKMAFKCSPFVLYRSKNVGWFLSDICSEDFEWTIGFLHKNGRNKMAD